MYTNIPEELKAIPNFVLWKYVYPKGDILQTPTKEPFSPHNEYHASVNNPATWGTFEDCVTALENSDMSGIGLVITPEIGLTCIDIDDPFKTKNDGTPKFENPEELLKRQEGVAKAFDTYQEISPSMKGLHIWVKGTVPTGRDKYSIGLYPSNRFMTMTGNVYNPSPIREYGELLHQLWSELGETNNFQDPGTDTEQTQSDNEILEAGSTAVNGEKFKDLYDGSWEKYYSSQSEADFALINMITYYTKSRVQIRRIFRNSALGRRKKAQRDKYIDDMVIKSFDNQPPDIDISALKKNLSQAFLDKIKPTEVEALPVSDTAILLKKLSPEIYANPGGLIGELAAFIYNAAPRPVPEIALAATIGIMSGICGRCYNVSGSGLNLNTVLLAKTGRGKEGMGSGISKLIASILPTVPQASLFIGPSRFASPEGLLKHISKTSKSFVSLMGEFTATLKRMSEDSRNAPQQGVKQVMLDVYNKSGKGQMLGNMVYSDATKNTEVLTAPAFSILAETVPETFYEVLSEKMICEGFLSRFVIIEYLGIRHPLNKNHQYAEVPERLKEQLGQLCAYALQLNSSDNVIEVQKDSESEEFLDAFGKECDDRINTSSSAETELWNRGHLNALRLSALLAIGTNYINPCVSIDQAKWATNLIRANIENLLKRFDAGEVGAPQAQNKQLDDLKKAFSWYLKKSWEDIKNYPGATENSHKGKVVPHSFLTAVCRSRASFKGDRIGPVQALRTLLMSLLESGEIQELSVMDKAKMGIGKNGKCYVVLDVKSFL